MMRSSLFFVVCILSLALADVTILEYDFDNVAVGTLSPSPSAQGAGVTGLDFTVAYAQNNGVGGWLCYGDTNCIDAIFINIESAPSTFNFGFSSTIAYTLTSISFFEGNNDCQEGFGPECSAGASFDVQYSTDASFSSFTAVGSFTPPSGSFQTQQYSMSLSLNVVPGTTYYFRFIGTSRCAISTGQYKFDNVIISGTTPTPQQTCSGFSFSGDSGYFCSADQTGYYYCLTGPFAPLDSFNLCPPGTHCACSWGVECSNGGTESPCRNADSP